MSFLKTKCDFSCRVFFVCLFSPRLLYFAVGVGFCQMLSFVWPHALSSLLIDTVDYFDFCIFILLDAGFCCIP